jgi:LmbE family N-acetylglucosaminyl deacetylase
MRTGRPARQLEAGGRQRCHRPGPATANSIRPIRRGDIAAARKGPGMLVRMNRFGRSVDLRGRAAACRPSRIAGIPLTCSVERLRRRENTVLKSAASVASVMVILSVWIPVACGYDWEPQPDKAILMVISTHPDDEGIFFGGLLPYYTQVQPVPLVHISMTSGDAHGMLPEVREGQLLCADWNYGLRNPPLFPRFKDRASTEGLVSFDTLWDLWADGVIDGQGIDTGELITATYVAEQFRRYRPEVVITQDFDGETGHIQHKGTAIVVADAYVLAADPAVELAGLPPWQVKKLYTHQYRTRTPSHPMITHLYADWTIPYAELGGLTPIQVCDAALCCHVYAGGCGIPAAYINYRDDPAASPYGLYRSTVGPDTLGLDGRAHDDFLEHIDLSDCNGNGIPDICDIASGFSADCNNDGVPDECQSLAPTIIAQPVSSVVVAGSTAIFAIQAAAGAPLTFRWRHSGTPLVDNSQITGSTTDTLAIDPVAPSNAGDYDVIVSNGCGSVMSAPATLRVTCAGRDLSDPLLSYCAGQAKTVYISIIAPPDAAAIAIEDQPPAGWDVSDISDGGAWDTAQHNVKWGPFFDPFPTQVSYSVIPSAGETGERCFVGRISIDGPYTDLCGDACISDLCCPLLPADELQPACEGCGDCSCATCGDNRVEMCEMTGYACAWKRGCNDDLDGMTRSGYIWQNGECYCWDSTEGNWFVSPCAPTLPGCCTGSGAGPMPRGRSEANRELPPFVTPGTWFGVSISLDPPAGVTAVALEDQPPTGWQVRAISGDGDWDATHGKVKWGPYFAPSIPASFSYEMYPPVEAAGEYCFDGAVSFDGFNQPLARDACVSTASWMRGDLNCDGALNAFDIDPFVLALTTPLSYIFQYPNCDIWLADVNQDGWINAFDIDPFVLLLTGG